jgi:hypothetical protein
MAIARVQVATGGGDAGQPATVTAVFGGSVTSGNLLIVLIRDNGDTVTGISDTLSTSYTLAGKEVAINPAMYIYSGVASSTGANTVSVTFSGNAYVWVYGIEVSGCATVSPLDAFDGFSTASAATDLTTDPITTSQSDTYIVMGASQGTFTVFSAGADFTLVDGTIPTNANDFGGVEEYIPGSVKTTYTPHLTSNTSAAYTAVVAAFKGAAAAGPSVPVLMNHYRQQRNG